MGYTRSHRYNNYKGRRIYNEDGTVKKRQIDPIKEKSAEVFKKYWDSIRSEEDYGLLVLPSSLFPMNAVHFHFDLFVASK